METSWLGKAGSVLEKIRTPLALGGLTVLVLFFLYKKVLELGIFPKLDGSQASQVLDMLLNNVFWLAIIAIVLGALSYILQLFVRAPAEPPGPSRNPPKKKAG